MPRKGSNHPPCRIEGCTNDSEHPSLDLCHACYQRIRNWSMRTVKQQIRRLDTLRKFEASMELVLGNVKPMRKKQRR